MLRLFIAVDLPADQQLAVAALCTSVRGARWVKPHQLHVTLRFLGDTPEEALPAIRARLAEVKAPAFRMAMRGVGVFPGARRPRVLWLGLAPTEPLLVLKREIDRVLGKVADAHLPGGKDEFHPHLTLARFPVRPDQSLASFLARHASYCGPEVNVDGFRLYRSTLAARGAIHELLTTYPLAEICREG